MFNVTDPLSRNSFSCDYFNEETSGKTRDRRRKKMDIRLQIEESMDKTLKKVLAQYPKTSLSQHINQLQTTVSSLPSMFIIETPSISALMLRLSIVQRLVFNTVRSRFSSCSRIVLSSIIEQCLSTWSFHWRSIPERYLYNGNDHLRLRPVRTLSFEWFLRDVIQRWKIFFVIIIHWSVLFFFSLLRFRCSALYSVVFFFDNWASIVMNRWNKLSKNSSPSRMSTRILWSLFFYFPDRINLHWPLSFESFDWGWRQDISTERRHECVERRTRLAFAWWLITRRFSSAID